jgi:predicted nuclease of predicted toxin-antitoxin system
VKFVIDAQLPPVMAVWLRAAGHEAQHVEDVGLRNADDTTIWCYAESSGAVIVTKDEDFAERAASVALPPMVVWLRIGNCSNAELRVWLEPRLAAIVQMAIAGRRIIEVI